jgi:aspartate kinase
VDRIVKELGPGATATYLGALAKVSVVGVGMRVHTGVARKMFKALADAKINIQNITTSEIKISCIIAHEDGPKALKIVHDAFELGKAK